jgi:hypothetical protein
VVGVGRVDDPPAVGGRATSTPRRSPGSGWRSTSPAASSRSRRFVIAADESVIHRARAVGASVYGSPLRRSMLCAYLSAAVLVGLGANALFGLWSADPAIALLIAGVALKEGRESWRGESCCTAPVVAGGVEYGCCDGGCCDLGPAGKRAE